MAVEGPSCAVFPTFGLGLGDVVQQRRPAQPEVVAGLGHLVEHLHGVIEIVLVSLAVDHLNAFQQGELRQDILQQPTFVEQHKARRRPVSHHDLVQLIGDALHRHDLDAFGVAGNGVERLGLDIEMQLRGETDGTHHAQRVVRVGDIRIQRRPDGQLLKVAHAIEGIQESAEVVFVQTDGHGVDGEVATVLVVLKGAVFHHGLAAVAVVRLTAGAHKLNLNASVTDHGSAKGAIVLGFLVAG